MPDGTRFIALFAGPDRALIDAVAEEQSVGRIEEKNPELADALGMSGDLTFPVAARNRRT
jgi:hypothetical protein